MTSYKQPSFFDGEDSGFGVRPHADDLPEEELPDFLRDLAEDDEPAEEAEAVGAPDAVSDDEPHPGDGLAAEPEAASDASASEARPEAVAENPDDPAAPEDSPAPDSATTTAAATAATVAPLLADADGSAFFSAGEGGGVAAATDDASLTSADTPSGSHMLDPGQAAVDAFFGPPRLIRPRPERPSVVPRWAWIAIGAAALVIVMVIGAVALSNSMVNVSVPQLTGVDVATARTRLALAGLTVNVSERRFSSKAVDTVLDQSPAVGTKLKRGDTVSVVVSAGSEQFALPNVVGDGLLLARGLLESRGLDVRVDSVPSQMPSDTVLASNPAAGQSVQTGDIVRLSVAAPGPTTQYLLPYDLTGKTFVIDPAPVNDAMTDVPLDVARRLRALIEASKGVVISTRALAADSTLDTVASRAARAKSATSTVAAIGFSAVTVGGGGLVVFSPSPVLANASESSKLASRVASDLASEVGAIQSATSTTDTVLAAANAPWLRIELGSFASRDDVSKFSDAAWEDSVARALYRAIASAYGKKVSQ